MAIIRTLPHSDEAEQSVLGAILIDKEAINLVSAFLLPEHFYNDLNGLIYSAMLTLIDNRRPIDLLTIADELKKHKDGKKVTSSYLSELVDVVPTAANIEHYANIVRNAGTRRSFIRAGGEIAELGFQEDK